MFLDKEGNFLKDTEGNEIKDLRNCTILLLNCNSSFIARDLDQKFIAAGFEYPPIIIASAGVKNKYSIASDISYKGTKHSVGNFAASIITNLKRKLENNETFGYYKKFTGSIY